MSHRILIADDHPLMRTALTQTIGQAIPGAVILEASRFDHIKPLLDTGEPPDIILLDLRMPVMDGIEFLKKLKPKENLPEAKIIVFSNYDDQHEIDQAFSLGAMHYMLKAWATPDELVKLIREVDNASQPVA